MSIVDYTKTEPRQDRILFALTIADLDLWLGRRATDEEIRRAEKALEYGLGEAQWGPFESEFGPAAEDCPNCGCCSATRLCDGCHETICEKCWAEHNEDAPDHVLASGGGII